MEPTTQDRPRRLLIVDDNVALARVTQFAFEKEGLSCEVATNGALALERAQFEQFDLIVTDQQMPVMTGTEFCLRLRELEQYRHTPIIMLTAKGLELELQKLRDELGIEAMFPKPFSPSAVVKAAHRLLSLAV